MSYISGNWSFDPFLILAVAVTVWHEIGLWRLARSQPEQARARRRRSLWFYGGLVVLLIAVESPIEYWAEDYFFVHMIQHLLLMFAAPTLIVAGAPWQPLRAALPGRSGPGVTGGAPAGGWLEGAGPLRAAGGFFLRPWVSVGLFNLVMIFWHLPGPFGLAENDQAVRVWLMHGSFLTAGVLFWLQFIPSPPFRQRMPLVSQAAALVVTNVIMIGIAMSLSIFVSGSVYPFYDHVPGVTLPPFADQQIGAALLWVCGDFWALPAIIVIVRKIVATEGGMSLTLDKMWGHGSAGAVPRGWASGGPGGSPESRGSWGPRGSRGSRGSWGRPRPGALDGVPAQQPSPPDAES
jgi:putative membrane protein